MVETKDGRFEIEKVYRMTDDLDIATDGKIYFSDASDKFGYGEDQIEVMEHTPNGRLLVYDPETKLTTTLLDNLYFANGVAVSPDDSFVLFNETKEIKSFITLIALSF